jgi:hypothetical protein
MRAMLDVVRRPVLLGSFVVPFIEQRIERLKNQFLVLFFRIGGHSLLHRLHVLPLSRRRYHPAKKSDRIRSRGRI